MLRESVEKLTPTRMRRALARVGLVLPEGAAAGADAPADDVTGWTPFTVDVVPVGGSTLMPAGWPEPPVPAVVHRTSGAAGENVQSIDYTTEASVDEVLAAYESALASYGAVREDNGVGEMVWGTAGDVAFQVTARAGAFTVLFAGQ